MSSKPVLTALVLAVLVGITGCGSSTKPPSSTTEPTLTPSSPTSTGTTPTDQPTSGASPTSPAVGLPTGFPAQHEVPLVSGVVMSKTGGKEPDGRVGWVIELSAVGTQQGCFDRAAAALVAAGFTKRAEMTAGDTKQAQFTTKKWAVIISARADGSNCRLGYEVGQLKE